MSVQPGKYYIAKYCGDNLLYLNNNGNLTKNKTVWTFSKVDNYNHFQIVINPSKQLTFTNKIDNNTYEVGLSPLGTIFLVTQNSDNTFTLNGNPILDFRNIYLSKITKNTTNTCSVVGTSEYTGVDMNFFIVPTSGPESSSSGSSNLPIILGVTIPVGVILLGIITYIIVRKVRKCKK